jgi:hypothetical protein
MTMSMLELWFVVSLLLPPAAVVIGAILLAFPSGHTIAHASGEHVYAGK